MRRQADLSEAVLSAADLPETDSPEAERSGAGATAAWPHEPVSAQRLRDAAVAQAQAVLKRELVRVYALSCGASRPKG